MNKSESVKNISEALVSAQAEMPAVKFNKVNPFLKNKYADLGAIIETAQPILAKHGLAISQLCVTDGEQVGVETVLLHKSGEWISSTMNIPAADEKGKSSAQVAGSIVTYIRRYALAAILGMYADEDGDGNDNGNRAVTKSAAKPRPAQPTPEPEPQADPMTVERACAITNSDGVQYGNLPAQKLSVMTIGIDKALAKDGLDPDKRQEYMDKREAIKVLLQANSDGSITLP